MTSNQPFQYLPLIPLETDLPEDPEDALDWLERAASSGDLDARYNLGLIFLDCEQPVLAMDFFRHAHYRGHALASRQIGAMCGKEDGTPVTDEDIEKWYKPIAEAGDPVAQFDLGTIYRKSHEMERSSTEAVRWLRRAGDQGHMVAQAELGMMYEHGLEIERDRKESAKWLRLAADQGYPRAQMTLAAKYLRGLGVEKDAEEAERLLLLCCEKGVIQAMVSLATLRAIGRGLEEDHKESMRWFRRVFSKAGADELYRFGHGLLSIGETQDEDRAVAHTWFQLAAFKGHEEAREAYLRLERELSAERLNTSRMIARKCMRSRRRTRRARRRSRKR